jgi:hypothetical protein
VHDAVLAHEFADPAVSDSSQSCDPRLADVLEKEGYDLCFGLRGERSAPCGVATKDFLPFLDDPNTAAERDGDLLLAHARAGLAVLLNECFFF